MNPVNRVQKIKLRTVTQTKIRDHLTPFSKSQLTPMPKRSVQKVCQ